MFRKIYLICLAVSTLCVVSAKAAVITKFPEVGAHEKVLVLEKNENPQNLLIVYTKLDKNCEPQEAGKQPVVGYYWLMNGETYKPVHSMIKSGIDKRLQVENGPAHSIVMHLSDLKELKTDLQDPTVEIKTQRSGSACKVEALLPLGPSDGNAVLKIAKIHTESEKTMLPPFRRVVSITLEGENAKTGAPIKKTFAGRM